MKTLAYYPLTNLVDHLALGTSRHRTLLQQAGGRHRGEPFIVGNHRDRCRRNEFGDLSPHQQGRWTFAPIKGKRESDHKRVDLPFRRDSKQIVVIDGVVRRALHCFYWRGHRT